MGYKQKDHAEIIGYKSKVSEILNQKFTLEMIRSLHEKLNIPSEALVKVY